MQRLASLKLADLDAVTNTASAPSEKFTRLAPDNRIVEVFGIYLVIALPVFAVVVYHVCIMNDVIHRRQEDGYPGPLRTKM